MKDEKIIKAVAELDGWKRLDERWKLAEENSERDRAVEDWLGIPLYLASRDAIVPVIEKQSYHIQIQFIDFLQQTVNKEYDGSDYADIKAAIKLMLATPRQLCEALLRATGKWKE